MAATLIAWRNTGAARVWVDLRYIRPVQAGLYLRSFLAYAFRRYSAMIEHAFSFFSNLPNHKQARIAKNFHEHST